jgi:hypothetical protein
MSKTLCEFDLLENCEVRQLVFGGPGMPMSDWRSWPSKAP